MRSVKQVCAVSLCAAALLFAAQAANAQKPQVRSRVVEAVDETRTMKMEGNVHPLARAEFDRGALGDSQPMSRMLLLLQRGDDQEASLRHLMEDQQTKGSANYHNWLTPAQFGAQFGPSDSDIQAVTDWLTRQGFQIAKVSAGKTTIEFSGNAGQVRNAFQTEIHQFFANGKHFVANVSEPSIPAALATVVRGVVALHNYPKDAQIRSNGQYRRNNSTGQVSPLFTHAANPGSFSVGPGDWNKIYNVPSPTPTSAGQKIAIVGQSNINTQDVVTFRSLFGLPPYSSVCTSALPPQCQLSVIVNGPDPGILGPSSTDDEGESDLDVEWAGAIAPQAQILLVVSQATISNELTNQISAGIDLSALYIVDNNLAPVMAESYAGCEPSLGTAGNQFYSTLWEQAAAQGITVVVAAGDQGPAACDSSQPPQLESAATQGLAVNGIASTPFNVAVGGTDFDTSTQTSTYWNPTIDTINSALKYMPETTWDNSACAAAFPAPCSTVDTTSYAADLSAAGGGPSNCMTSSSTACTGAYPKPAFQFPLTKNDQARDVPDISFFSSNGGPLVGGSNVSIVVCQSDAITSGATSCDLKSPYTDFQGVGGTSAAAPAFAAVMALVNNTQKTPTNPDGRQGNANYVLYALAGADTNYTTGKCNSSIGNTPNSNCVFNDVAKGNTGVACVLGSKSIIDGDTTWCQGSGAFGVTISSSAVAYGSGPGYDYATGLGSINVENLLMNWGKVNRTTTTTTLMNPSGGTASGQIFTASISVSPTPPAPTTGTWENVSLIALASDQATVLGSFGPFALKASGTASVSTNLLPPGTAYVAGSYSGDANHAASTSTPIALSGTVAGSNQTSTLTVYYVGFDSSGNPLAPTTSAQNFVYGSGNGYILKIVVNGPNGSCSISVPSTKPEFPCPTGTITLSINGQPLTDFLKNGAATATASLNNQGFAEDQLINVPVGTNNITATYSGDPNYAAANTSNKLVITVTQATTATAVASSLSSVISGTSVQLMAGVSSTSGGEAPCGITKGGTVAFTNNGAPLSGTITYTAIAASSTAGAGCTASLTTAISSLYPAPVNRPKIPALPLLFFALSLVIFLALIRWMPGNRRRIYACAGFIAFAFLTSVVAGCGGGGGGGGGGGSTRMITAAYSGDTNYSTSKGSTTITITTQ